MRCRRVMSGSFSGDATEVNLAAVPDDFVEQVEADGNYYSYVGIGYIQFPPGSRSLTLSLGAAEGTR